MNAVESQVKRGHSLANDQRVIRREAILWNLQVQRSGALANTARDIVVRAVARAEPTTEVAGFTDGDAAEVSADT